MSPDVARSLFRGTVWRWLAGAVVLLVVVFLFAADARPQPPLVPADTAGREYVRVAPGIPLGAGPTVRAGVLNFDAAKGQGEIPVECMPQGFWKSKWTLGDAKYDRFEFDPAAGAHLTVVGEPNVPILVMEVDIPPDAEFAGVTLKPEVLKTLEDTTLAPNQKPLPIGPQKLISSRPTATVKAQLYASKTAYPGRLYGVVAPVYFGGRKIVILRTFPVQFFPAAKKVEVLRLSGVVRFKAKEVPKQETKRDVSKTWGKALAPPILNQADAERWPEYRRTIPAELKTQVDSIAAARGLALEQPLPCVIVTADSLRKPAERLATHRTAKGTPASVVGVKEIVGKVAGKDAPEKIRNFIRVMHTTRGTSWVILFGDVGRSETAETAEVPTRMVVDPDPYSGVDDGQIPCDFYYACLDGSWDGNNNGKYGEAADKPDLAPEVSVGRIPAGDPDGASAIVDAVIRYENSPPAFKGVLLAANDLGWGGQEVTFKKGSVVPLFENAGVSVAAQLYEREGDLSLATFSGVVNGGIDLVEYYGHGSPDSTQLMKAGQVQSGILPTPSYPLVFALSCSTARYDNQHSFAETWIDGIKASAYVGSTRVAYGSEGAGEGLETRFFKNHLKSRRAGDSLVLAKYGLFKDYGLDPYTLKTVLEFTLLGDPIMRRGG